MRNKKINISKIGVTVPADVLPVDGVVLLCHCADPASGGSSLEAQLRLKRARLAEDLNEKLALRPGPLELVQKNIIPLDSAVTMSGINKMDGRTDGQSTTLTPPACEAAACVCDCVQ